MLIDLGKWIFSLAGMFYAWNYLTNGNTIDEPIGLIGWAYVIIFGGGIGLTLGVMAAWPFMTAGSFIGRIKSGCSGMSNDKIADKAVVLALSEFGEKLRDMEIDIIYVDQKIDEKSGWTKYYFKATSPVLDRFEQVFGQTYGFVFRMNEGWKPYYFVDAVNGKNNRMKELTVYLGGDSRAAAKVIAKTAEGYHEAAIRKLKKTGELPRKNDGTEFDAEFEID
jgi:hypothetical protein